MNPCTALAILSRPAPAGEEEQHQLSRAEAVVVLAEALGLLREAAAAREVVVSLKKTDRLQMRLFELLEGGQSHG